MPNYYQLVEVQPTASAAEIESAIDARYNQWRALVTHHDDTTRDQANQALRLLEQIRATLTDSAKRAVYDEAIGVKGATAGLVDPTAVMKMPRVVMTPPPPPRPPVAKQGVSEASTSRLWACQKCGEKNPEHTQFCYNCGTQLVRECPKCHKNTSLVATGFCGNCGANYDETKKRIECRRTISEGLKQITGQQAALMRDASTFESQAKVVRKRIYDNSLYIVPALMFLSIGALLGVLVLVINIFLMPFALASLFLGAALIYFAGFAKKSFNEKRDAEARVLEDQATEKKNQAHALHTSFIKLREQLKELAE